MLHKTKEDCLVSYIWCPNCNGYLDLEHLKIRPISNGTELKCKIHDITLAFHFPGEHSL